MSWKTCFRHDLLDGKVALVTGGGTGIGRCIAQELASIGCLVVIASRNVETLEKAAKEMNSYVNIYTKSSGRVVPGLSTSIQLLRQ